MQVFLLRRNKAQVLSEYAIVFAIALGAFFAMQTYAKRGLQAVVKDAADEIGFQEDGDKENFLDYKGEKSRATTDSRSHSEKEDTYYHTDEFGPGTRFISLIEKTHDIKGSSYSSEGDE